MIQLPHYNDRKKTQTRNALNNISLLCEMDITQPKVTPTLFSQFNLLLLLCQSRWVSRRVTVWDNLSGWKLQSRFLKKAKCPDPLWVVYCHTCDILPPGTYNTAATHTKCTLWDKMLVSHFTDEDTGALNSICLSNAAFDRLNNTQSIQHHWSHFKPLTVHAPARSQSKLVAGDIKGGLDWTLGSTSCLTGWPNTAIQRGGQCPKPVSAWGIQYP